MTLIRSRCRLLIRLRRLTPQPKGKCTTPTASRRLPSKVPYDSKNSIDRIVKDLTKLLDATGRSDSLSGRVTPADKIEAIEAND